MRDQLIEVAIAKFGRCGFDGVGTREIAASVGTPMSSITYHFGGKEGLYRAAAEHIFEFLHEHVAPRMDDLPTHDATPEQRVEIICKVLRRIGTFMLSEDSAPFALFIGREQQDPSPDVIELMREWIMPMISALVAQVHVVRPDLDENQAKATSLYLFGMAVTLRHSRASIRLLLDEEDLSPASQTMLLDQLQANARFVLEGGGS